MRINNLPKKFPDGAITGGPGTTVTNTELVGCVLFSLGVYCEN